jgi:hypothetical protein
MHDIVRGVHVKDQHRVPGDESPNGDGNEYNTHDLAGYGGHDEHPRQLFQHSIRGRPCNVCGMCLLPLVHGPQVFMPDAFEYE